MNAPEKLAPLPELSDARIDDIEGALFARIADDRAVRQRRRARRGRAWMAGGAAAAVVVVAALVAPGVAGIVGGSSGADYSAVQPATGGGFSVLPDGAVVDGTQLDGVESTSGGASEESSRAGDAMAPDREIITTASASITVDDVRESAGAIGDAAAARGGYVESMSIGTSGAVPIDPQTGLVYDTTIYPPTDGGWISVRVPSGELADLVGELNEFGDVTASSIDRLDVTEQTVDLDARIEAAQASVDRLNDLMAQAGDLSDLIAAEAALSERQANLESLQQQREMLGDQVDMSTLTVALSPVVETVQADPAGFADGLVAGWNGLVATLNGIVIALGFLLPWLGIAVIAALIVWGIVRATRRRRARRVDETADGSPGR